MNRPCKRSQRPNPSGLAAGSTLALIAAMAISTPAHAEYRCSTPGLLTLREVRACELARQDTPDELVRYVHRMNRINAGLLIDDYVGPTDAQRWSQARQRTRLTANGSAWGGDKGN